MAKEKKLSVKQELFIEAYLRSFNMTQAALDAGYSEKTAYAIGAENLKKPQIKNEIDKRLNELLEDKRRLTALVIEETARIASADIKEFINNDGVKNLEKADTRPLASVEFIETVDKDGKSKKVHKKVKLLDKNKALENMAKYIGLCNFDNDDNKGVTFNFVLSKDFIPKCNMDDSDGNKTDS